MFVGIRQYEAHRGCRGVVRTRSLMKKQSRHRGKAKRRRQRQAPHGADGIWARPNPTIGPDAVGHDLQLTTTGRQRTRKGCAAGMPAWGESQPDPCAADEGVFIPNDELLGGAWLGDDQCQHAMGTRLFNATNNWHCQVRGSRWADFPVYIVAISESTGSLTEIDMDAAHGDNASWIRVADGSPTWQSVSRRPPGLARQRSSDSVTSAAQNSARRRTKNQTEVGGSTKRRGAAAIARLCIAVDGSMELAEQEKAALVGRRHLSQRSSHNSRRERRAQMGGQRGDDGRNSEVACAYACVELDGTLGLAEQEKAALVGRSRTSRRHFSRQRSDDSRRLREDLNSLVHVQQGALVRQHDRPRAKELIAQINRRRGKQPVLERVTSVELPRVVEEAALCRQLIEGLFGSERHEGTSHKIRRDYRKYAMSEQDRDYLVTKYSECSAIMHSERGRPQPMPTLEEVQRWRDPIKSLCGPRMCAACGDSKLQRHEYSNNQWAKPQGRSRCRSCVDNKKRHLTEQRRQHAADRAQAIAVAKTHRAAWIAFLGATGLMRKGRDPNRHATDTLLRFRETHQPPPRKRDWWPDAGRDVRGGRGR